MRMVNKMNNFIENSNLVCDFFGYFPSFHDSEILDVRMDRNGAVINMTIKAIEMSSEIENGKYLINKECKIEFKFISVLGMELKDFNNQNVLDEIVFKKESKGIETIIKSSYGLEGYIISSGVSIISLASI
jgi:hypothetical protein